MTVAPFLARCHWLQDDLAAIDDGCVWRLGGVVLARSGNAVAVIRKAARPGYDFSRLWALPGGMARQRADGEETTLSRSISERASKEIGLRLGPIVPRADLGPIVTEYSSRGAPRRTLITVFESVLVPPMGALQPGDASIEDATWLDFPPKPAIFAPANRLILGHLVWPRLSEDLRLDWRVQLETALTHCAEAAIGADVASPPAPWDSQQEIDAWRQAWP